MSFDTALAQLTLDLSAAAYKDEAECKLAVERLGLTDFSFFDGPSTQAFLCRSGDRQFVAFRGSTENPLDWVTNARFSPRPGVFGARVHVGFRDALDEVWAALNAQLSSSTLPVVFAGHSLGGALATLAAARHIDDGGMVEAVYTLGQPRTGIGGFRTEYDNRLLDVTFRIINHIDLVTRVPLLVQGYRHIGRRMYFDDRGTFHRDASAWKVARDDLKFRLRHFGRIKAAGLEPHFINAYRRAIGRI